MKHPLRAATAEYVKPERALTEAEAAIDDAHPHRRLVLQGLRRRAELYARTEQVSAALVERGLSPHTASNVSAAVGAQSRGGWRSDCSPYFAARAKGAMLARPDQSLREHVIFQCQPTRCGARRKAQATESAEQWRIDRTEALRLRGAPIETIALDVDIDATDQSPADPLASSIGVYPQLFAPRNAGSIRRAARSSPTPSSL
jgi:hypothetical protein